MVVAGVTPPTTLVEKAFRLASCTKRCSISAGKGALGSLDARVLLGSLTAGRDEAMGRVTGGAMGGATGGGGGAAGGGVLALVR